MTFSSALGYRRYTFAGLDLPAALSVYIHEESRPGRTGAACNSISKIRAEGLRWARATAAMGVILRQARECRLSGTALKTAAHAIEKG